MVKKILSFLLLFHFANYVAAQSPHPFDSLMTDLEKRFGVKIFYDSRQTVDLEIPAFSGNTIDTLLKQVLRETGFSFYQDQRNRIFISRGNPLNPALAKDFFSRKAAPASADSLFHEPETETAAAAIDNMVYAIGNKKSPTATAVITGTVRDARNGEPLIGTSVSVEGYGTVSTDGFGFYSINVPRGRHLMKLSFVGMKDVVRQIQVWSSGKFNIEMREEVRSLKSAVVVAQKQSNVRGMQMGMDRLNIKTIKQIPAIFGETDLMRAILTLPGVTSVGEGTAGYNVRGGATDQNLILLNDMTLYNPTHLFGFFSAVDPELVRGLELYKSAIPEKFGGRISSIMDVTTRDGNSKRVSGTAGVGPLTSRFTLEGPLGSEKTTFLMGGRLTYSDWLLNQIPDKSFNSSKASFYDGMLHLSHIFSDKDRIYLSGYSSNDRFRLNKDSTYSYTNLNAAIKWKHNFSNTFYGVLSGVFNQYNYTLDGRNNPKDAYAIQFGVKQYDAKADFTYTPNNRHEIKFGIQHLIYRLQPGSLKATDPASEVSNKRVQAESGTETSVYLGDQYAITDALSLQAGIRYSYYRYLGPQQVYLYAPGEPRNTNTVQDSVTYNKGDLVQAYHGPEFRISAKYILSAKTSIKFSFNTLRQYIQMISNTTAISPTDTWKLSDQYVKPQIGQQISLGFYANPGKKGIEISVEAYLKQSKHTLDYKSGAQLLLNHAIERDVINTVGKAYGVELLLKKPTGKLNGWISYTYSRSFLKADDPLAGEVINKGKYYPSNYDKPNIVSLVGNYRFTQRFSISLTSTYSTGRPITLPIGTFNMGGGPRVLYSERNAYRIPDFFRTDFSMMIDGNHKVKQRFHSSWTFGVYNLTGRDNPYSVYFTLENGEIKGYQLSVFGTAIPFISYNLRF
jgi:hypothetical protein